MRRSVLACAATSLLALLAVSAAQAANPPAAKSSRSASGRATATIIRPLKVSAKAELSFGTLMYSGSGSLGSVVLPAAPPSTRTATKVQLFSGGGETPLVRGIQGEPGRSYRVSVPKSVASIPGGLLVDQFTLWSQNARDITRSRTGLLDSSGNDTLRIGGTLSVPKGTKKDIYSARVPVTISYE